MSDFKELVDNIIDNKDIMKKLTESSDTPGQDDTPQDTPQDAPQDEVTPGQDDAPQDTPEEPPKKQPVKYFPHANTVNSWAKQMKECYDLLANVKSDHIKYRFRSCSHLPAWKVDYINRLHVICSIATSMLGRTISIEPEVVEMAVNNGIPALNTFYEYHVEATTQGCANPDAYSKYAHQVSTFKDICQTCTRTI